MKTLIINNLYHPFIVGGAERSVRILSESLAQLGVEVTVLSLQPEPGLTDSTLNNVRNISVGLENDYWPFDSAVRPVGRKLLWHLKDLTNHKMGSAVKTIIRDVNPSVIHTNNISGFSPSVWQETFNASIPLVHTLRDYYLLCPKTTMFKSGQNCQNRCVDCSLLSRAKLPFSANVDAVVGISQFILNRHEQFGFFKDTRHKSIIPNPVETVEEQATSVEKNSVLRVGYLGKIEEFKGIGVLINALRQWDTDKWELVIGGNGDKSYIQGLMTEISPEKVRLLGFIEPQKLFNQIDVLVVPSLWNEPFGRIIIESFASGKPVIASRRGGIADLVNEGQTGFLFDPDSIASLQESLRKMVAVKVNGYSLSDACKKEAQKYAPLAIANRYLDVYKQVTSSG